MSDEHSPLASGRKATQQDVKIVADRGKKKTFSSSLSVLISSLGSVVGTGNIWRFPRICARNAADGGGLVFLMVWFSFLWFWSMPVLLIEYATGRFTRKGPTEGFAKLAGPAFRFLGTFITMNTILTAGYYAVIVGWCVYYFFKPMAGALPTEYLESREQFYYMQEGHLQILCTMACIVFCALSVSKGVSTFEPVNLIVVPTLLVTLAISFYWAISLKFASYGIEFLFQPHWSSFGNIAMWRDAISQNAWDTGAGAGLFFAYAAYMKRSQGVVKLSIITPLINNVISLFCGIMIFSCVFAIQLSQDALHSDIIRTLNESGPANTGLTFIWMPVLYSSIEQDGLGRFFCCLFFFTLTLAGISSLIAMFELGVQSLNDFGIKRIPATVLVTLVIGSLSIGSSVSIDFLINQDSTWSFGLIFCGLFMLVMVYRYGICSYRRTVVNEYGVGDLKLPICWIIIVVTVCPAVSLALLGWYLYDSITQVSLEEGVQWYSFTRDSFMTTVTEWFSLIMILMLLNWWLKPLNIKPKNPSDRRWRVLSLFVHFDAERPEGYKDSRRDRVKDIIATPSQSPISPKKKVVDYTVTYTKSNSDSKEDLINIEASTPSEETNLNVSETSENDALIKETDP